MKMLINSKNYPTKISLGLFLSLYSSFVFAYIIHYFAYLIDHLPFPSEILPHGLILILLLASVLMSLFPIIALYPGWNLKKNITILSFPVVIVILIFILFSSNIIQETVLPNQYSLNDNLKLLIDNIDTIDVKIRLILFSLIIIIPIILTSAFYFYYLPHSNRKPTKYFKYYILSSIILLSSFVCFCLKINYSLYYISIVFPIYLFLLILGYSGDSSFLTKYLIPHKDPYFPLSSKEVVSIPDNLTLSAIWNQVDSYIKNEEKFTKDINIDDLSYTLHIKKAILQDVFYRKGFNTVKEYLNYLRIAKFKKIVVERPSEEITVLIEESGFNSKTTFYRLFNFLEGCSPKEYIAEYYNHKNKRG